MLPKKTNHYRYLIPGMIMLLALLLRLWGLDFGLPHLLARPDEETIVPLAVKMFTGDLNPHFFNYPSLYIYLLFAAYNLFYLLGRLGGSFQSLTDLWLLYFRDASVFYLIARYLSLISGMLIIPVIYQTGRRFYSTLTGEIAAFFVAGAFLLGREAHFGVTDATLTLFGTLTVFYCLSLYESGRTRDFCLAALFGGLAMSTKYPGALLVFPLTTACFLRFHQEGCLKRFYAQRRFWLLPLIGISVFFLCSPYILLDFKSFYRELTQVLGVVFVSSEIKGQIPTAYWQHLRITLRYGLGLPLLAAALASLVWQGLKRRGFELIIISYVLGFYLVTGYSGSYYYLRYLVPILPPLALLAAIGLVEAGQNLFRDRLGGGARLAFTWLTALLLIAPSLYGLISFDRLIARKDTRVQAKEWLERRAPSGSVIIFDGDFYNNLALTPGPQEMRKRTERYLPGFFDRYIGSDFTRIFPEPWYDLHYVNDYYFFAQNLTVNMPEPTRQARQLFYSLVNKVKPRYLVTSVPPHGEERLFLNPELVGSGQFKRLKQFTPYNQSSEAVPRFDKNDAFFVPYTGFSALKYPGPKINIYEFF